MSNFVGYMLTRNRKKEIISLKIKKYRQKYGQFIVEGEKSVGELCHSDYTILEILITPPLSDSARTLCPAVTPMVVTEADMKQMSSMDTPPGILAVAAFRDPGFELTDLNGRISLMLDGVSDPGNLGTIVRIADWFGIRYVFCSPDCVDIYNPKTITSTMGSFTRVKVVYTPLPDLIRRSGLPVYACMMNGRPPGEIEKPREGFILTGNEANGVGGELSALSTCHISIPGKGNAESLNVAVATAIVCDRFING